MVELGRGKVTSELRVRDAEDSATDDDGRERRPVNLAIGWARHGGRARREGLA